MLCKGINKKLFLVLPLLIFLFSFIPNALAYSSATITLNAAADEKLEYPNQAQCTLQNGYFAYAYPDFHGGAVNSYIIVNVYSQTGVLTNHFNVTVDLNYGGSSSPYHFSYSLALYNTTCLQLWVVRDVYTGATGYLVCDVTYLNIISASQNTITLTLLSGSGANFMGFQPRLSYVFYYNNLYYAIIGCPRYESSGSDSRICIVSNNGTNLTFQLNTTFTGHYGTHPTHTPQNGLFCFQDSNNANLIYAMFAWEDTSTTPKYYSIDLNALVITELATYPISGVISNDRHNFFIGGGTATDNSTGNIFLYWIWTYSYLNGTTPLTNLYEHRLVFNSSGVAVANLLAQNTRQANFYPNLPVETTPIFHVGYSSGKDIIITIYPVYTASTSTYYEEQATTTVPNWYNYATTSLLTTQIQVNLNGTEPIPYVNAYDLIGRLSGVAYQTNEYSTTVKIYYNMSPFVLNWSTSLTYIPTDNPLQVYTTYQYTLNTYLNGLGYQTIDAIYFDNTYSMTVQTSSSGGYVFSACNSVSAGIHTIMIVVIYNSQNVYNQTYSYTFVFPASTTPTTNQLMPSTIIAVSNMMVPLMLIGFTSMAFFTLTKGNIMGLMFGAALGAIILGIVKTEYAPLMYVTIFITAIVFIYMIGHNSGGG